MKMKEAEELAMQDGTTPPKQSEMQTKLDEMRKRCEAASEGPWRMIPTGMDKTSMATLDVIGSHNHTPYMSHANARFCANARSDLPLLISALEVCLGAIHEAKLWCDVGAVEKGEDYTLSERLDEALEKAEALLVGEEE